MMRLLFLCTFLLTASAAQAQDAAKGQAVFKRICAACHSVDRAKPKPIAPTLAGVLGRKGGSYAGARYSAAMKKAAPVWTEAALDKYLANPKAFVPGTSMLMKVANPQDRKNVIAYLKTVK